MSRRPGTDSLSPFSPAAAPLYPGPDFSIETALIAQGSGPVAGTDEAGRGPLAGPVMAAAVILDPQQIPAGLDDSKRLTERRREALFDAIVEQAHAVSFAWVAAPGIDRLNIRQASLEAMRRAVVSLSILPRHVIVDGRDVPPGLPCPATALVKGDARALSIAAASIVAKVARDRMMQRCDVSLPGYGFAAHKGYGSAMHVEAIRRLGPTLLHRLSFEPLASLGTRPAGSSPAQCENVETQK